MWTMQVPSVCGCGRWASPDGQSHPPTARGGDDRRLRKVLPDSPRCQPRRTYRLFRGRFCSLSGCIAGRPEGWIVRLQACMYVILPSALVGFFSSFFLFVALCQSHVLFCSGFLSFYLFFCRFSSVGFFGITIGFNFLFVPF